MNRKNKKLLILVIVLIVLAIGTSFAYFGLKILFSGTGSTTEGITKTVQNTTFVVEGELEFSDTDILPGHKQISAIKVTATGEEVNVNYNVIWQGINSLYTELRYTVYKTTNTVDVTIICEKQEEKLGSAMIYSEQCTINNEDLLGEVVSSGVITNSNESRTIVLKENETITATTSGATAYYYVVLEYPNLDSIQNRDSNGTFDGEVTVEEYKELVCGTHNVTTALGTLAINDCEPQYGFTSIQADSGEACLYNGNSVSSFTNLTEETCKTVFNVTDLGYYDGTVLDIYQKAGSGTWNSETSTCTYNNINVNMPAGTAPTEADCNKDLYCSSNRCFAGIEEVGSGEWGEISGATGIYETQDEEGTSYYYRGNVENNYVKFADKYWRIIRINGNGSLRLIYSGEVATVDGAGKETVLKNGYDDSSTYYTQIGTSAYNSGYNQAEYVGYMYTLDSLHGLSTDSTIKGVLDTWYTNNLSSYASYLDTETGFCNDRTLYSGTGIGTTETYYSAYIRLVTNKEPTLKCSDTNDYFTIKNSIKGNKALTNPIGLITADEIMYAGGGIATNKTYYLYTGYYYWSMSPYIYDSKNGALVFFVGWDGYLTYSSVYVERGVRPVINVSTDNLEITGKGTILEPYVIVE